jgi:hypothetical protein
MKLSEYRGDDALEVLAELLEPAVEILADADIAAAWRDKNPNKTRGQKQLKAVSIAIKKHKEAVIAILAALDHETPDEYREKINVVTLPKKLLEVLNDKDLRNFFTSQEQTKDEPSGSASASTEVPGQ